jgi:hypothetical protein
MGCMGSWTYGIRIAVGIGIAVLVGLPGIAIAEPPLFKSIRFYQTDPGTGVRQQMEFTRGEFEGQESSLTVKSEGVAAATAINPCDGLPTHATFYDVGTPWPLTQSVHSAFIDDFWIDDGLGETIPESEKYFTAYFDSVSGGSALVGYGHQNPSEPQVLVTWYSEDVTLPGSDIDDIPDGEMIVRRELSYVACVIGSELIIPPENELYWTGGDPFPNYIEYGDPVPVTDMSLFPLWTGAGHLPRPIKTVAVPEPSGAIQLATGLLALLGLHRARNRG